MIGLQGGSLGLWGRQVRVNDTRVGFMVDQLGSGNIVEFRDGGTAVFTIADGGAITITGSFRFADDQLLKLGTDSDIAMLLRSTVLDANTALASVLIGTPVAQAIAANSAMISNVTASGDVAVYVNKGGHSQMVFWADGSSGDTAILVASGASFDVYVAGTKVLDYATGVFAFQQNVTVSSTGSLTITTPIIASLYQASGGGLISVPASVGADTVCLIAATQTLTAKTLTSPDINAGTADSLTSLSIRSTGAAYDLIFATAVVFSANRTLTITIPDAATALTLTGDFIRSGAHSLTLTTTATTNVTLPTTGTLATLAGAETFTAKLGYNGLVITADTGVITTGTWNGTTIAVANGGTGVTTSTGTVAVVLSTSPILVTPILGVASATSLATSAAIPLLLTYGQLVNISLTSQTVGATTLTIPDFASVVDEFVFKTKAVTMSNKTFVAPALGAATATSINGLIITTTAGTLTIANDAAAALVTSGAYSITLTATAATNVTLPTTGTLATLAGAETFTAKLGYNGLVVTADTGAVTTGSWTATVISPVYGGTGVANNVASTLTITGAYTLGLTLSAATALTLPTTGTLATLAGTEELDNKTLDSSVLKGTLTASGIVTLPAFTLGGTVTGGNQTVDSLGHVGFSNTAAHARFGIYSSEALTITDNNSYGSSYSIVSGAKTTAAYTNTVYGTALDAGIGASNSQDWTSATAGLIAVWTILTITAGATGTLTTAANFWATTSLGAMTTTNRYGLYVVNAAGAGTLTNQYGVFIEDMTKGGTLDIGLAIAGADTAALWLSSGADNTDAPNGIFWGLSRDTNLYRSAANTLKTDDAFSALSYSVGASAGVDFGPGGVTSITVSKGIVTAIS